MKQQIDEVLYKDERAMDNEKFFRNTVRNRVFTTLVAMNLLRQNVSADIRNRNMQDIQEISRLIISEYTNQYKQYTFKTA